MMQISILALGNHFFLNHVLLAIKSNHCKFEDFVIWKKKSEKKFYNFQSFISDCLPMSKVYPNVYPTMAPQIPSILECELVECEVAVPAPIPALVTIQALKQWYKSKPSLPPPPS